MKSAQPSRLIQEWPDDSREAAQLVLDAHGETDEATETQLTWHRRGPWKRIVASKASYPHDFPAPDTDAVESLLDYRPARSLPAATTSRPISWRSISCMRS